MTDAPTNRKYHNLILTSGTVEGANVAYLTVAWMYEEGFNTPREILQGFRDTLMKLVESLMTRASDEGECPHCTNKTRTIMARYCEFCGTQLRIPPDELTEGLAATAADRFRYWFKQQVHEFSDWEFFSECGWNVCWMVDGGFVKLDGFDGFLEEWDPDDYEDNLREGRTWWDSLLQGCSTGEVKVDAKEGYTP